MTKEEFDKLLPGDIVREKKTGLGYVVMGSVRGGGVILVRVLHLVIPEEIEYIDRNGIWGKLPVFEKRRKPKRKIEINED